MCTCLQIPVFKNILIGFVCMVGKKAALFTYGCRLMYKNSLLTFFRRSFYCTTGRVFCLPILQYGKTLLVSSFPILFYCKTGQVSCLQVLFYYPKGQISCLHMQLYCPPRQVSCLPVLMYCTTPYLPGIFTILYRQSLHPP